LSPILSNYSQYLTDKSLEGFDHFNTEGQIIRTVTYADDLLLLAKYIDRPIGNKDAMELNENRQN